MDCLVKVELDDFGKDGKLDGEINGMKPILEVVE